MSDKGSILKRTADWARDERESKKAGRILILNKYNMEKSLLDEVHHLYSDVSDST